MKTILTHCTVIDGTGRPPLSDATVVVEDETIRYVGTSDNVGATELAQGRAIDLQAGYLLPGLMNMHVHLAIKFPFSETKQDEPAADVAFRAARRATDALQAGITTLRIVGEAKHVDIATRRAIHAGWLEGPRLLCAGHALIATGGHGHNANSTLEVDGADEFRKMARQQLRAGADHIKLCITGGIGTRREGITDSQVTQEEMAAAIEVAHQAGKPVCAHAGAPRAIQQAIEVGLDCVEHGYVLDHETVTMMRDAGTYLVPTLSVTRAEDWMRAHDFAEWTIQKALAASESHLESIRAAIEAGVKIAVGTDIPPADQFDGTTATVREIELLVEAGMTPTAALEAATRVPAELCQIAHRVGTIEVGKVADFVATVQNPIGDITRLRDIAFVMKGGEIVRNALTAD